jgi:aliphatic sulfonates family ABC transporter substrate-binding protein
MPILEFSGAGAPPMRARALVFEAPASRALLARLEQIAPTDATVLITGETGTGKEIVARHLHDRSTRSNAPFVAVNCGALSPSLLESELFGHERGAFTGAVASHEGWFEAADRGTLFLDEVGDLPLSAQVKILRVLQEREFVRVGARRAVPVDVRLIAATNAKLEQAVAEGRFREDLYYRLHVARVMLPPLRERKDDILPLARHFLGIYASRLGVHGAELTEGAIGVLLDHPWPGNIRELENVIHRALLVARDGRIAALDLQLTHHHGLVLAPSPSSGAARKEGETSPDPLVSLESALVALFEKEGPRLYDEVEAVVFRTAYAFSDSNQVRAARLLGISRNVLRARLQQYGLLAPASRAQGVLQPIEDPSTTGAPADRAPRIAASAWPMAEPAAMVKPSASPNGVRMRIGSQPLGILSLLNATGSLEEALSCQGVRIEWVQCATGMHVIDALAAGTLDAGVVGEVPPIFAQAARAPIVYLAAEPPAPEGEAIIVLERSSISSVADLRGKSIAVTRGANVVYFVVRALEDAGLTLDDVRIRALSPADAQVAFEVGEVDGWAVWNPILASVKNSTKARILRDARGLANNRSIYVGRSGFADAHPEIIGSFLEQVAATGRWANANRQRAAALLSSKVGQSPRDLEEALATTPFNAGPLDSDVIVSQQRIADVFHRLRLITRPVDVKEAVWTPPLDVRRSA